MRAASTLELQEIMGPAVLGSGRSGSLLLGSGAALKFYS